MKDIKIDNLINQETLISHHYDMACELAINLVEQYARQILIQHKNLDEFIMAMGGWCFTDKNGNNVDDKHYMKRLDKFISEWDGYLKITGNPIRFTANGPIITDW